MSCACGSGSCGGCGKGFNGSDCVFATVKTSCPTVCEPFSLGDGNICFQDSIVTGQIEASGTPIEYWFEDIKNAIRDPLYGEPVQRAWRGPFKMMGMLEYPPAQAESREEGFRVTWQGTLYLARKTLDDLGAPFPHEGDIVKFWGNKFFAQHATGGAGDPGGGYYFDVTNVDDDMHVYSGANFLGYKMTIVRRTEFAPERRLAEG